MATSNQTGPGIKNDAIKGQKESKEKGNATFEKLANTWRRQNNDEEPWEFPSLCGEVLRVAINQFTAPTTQSSAKEGFAEFLEERREKHTKGIRGEESPIDDCVRWQILLAAIKSHRNDMPENKKQARLEIISIITKTKPYLAFESPVYPKTREFFKHHCLDTDFHDPKDMDKTTPFHAAARIGHYAAMRNIISNGRRLYDEREDVLKFLPTPRSTSTSDNHKPRTLTRKLLDVVMEVDPDSKTAAETALALAAKAGPGAIETLEVLLGVEGIDSPENLKTPFTDALKDGSVEVVNRFLEPDHLPEILVDPNSILTAIENIDKPIQSGVSGGNREEASKVAGERDRKARLEMVKSMVKKSKRPGIFDHKVMQVVIRQDLMDIWDVRPPGALEEELGSYLLHLAVYHQNLNFVERLADDPEFHKSLTELCDLSGDGAIGPPGTKRPPLWYNNHRWNNNTKTFDVWSVEGKEELEVEIHNKIRNKIVNTMICQKGMERKVLDIFQQSDEPVGDMCFDISRFNSSAYRVSTFVDSLISHTGSQRLLSYEETLRYVAFPSLDALVEDREKLKENSHLETKEYEVFKVLKWLRDDKKVKKILKLKVPDRLLNPHDDEEMAKQVDEFEIEALDWKVPDLSISIFTPETKARLKELHLYSSGKRSVVGHWFSNEGIKSLKELETLEIKVIQETTTLKHCEALVNEIRDLVYKLNLEKLGTPEVTTVPWYPKPKADLSEIAFRIAPKLARWLLNLKAWVKTERLGWKGEGDFFKPTKVAILDNGILSVSHTSSGTARDGANKDEDSGSLWTRIEAGRSFVDDDSWLFASNPHGTQMANLICAIDPFCKIYVARVAEDSFGITAERVRKAIEWARQQDVDVISMSFVIGEHNQALFNEILEATNQGIVMTCSAHDEGSRVADAYPVLYSTQQTSLMVLAACDEYGQLLREAKGNKDGDKFGYKIKGKNVTAGVIPFLAESDEPVSGSSVSTALAAGMCSLILTCDRLANPGKAPYAGGKGEGSRWELVIKHLEDMQSTPNSNFVLLEKLCQIDTPHIGQQTPETGSPGGPSANFILRKYFKERTPFKKVTAENRGGVERWHQHG